MTPPREDSAATDGGSDDPVVSFSVTIEDGETLIAMRGDRDTAVVVRSESGERIYLPPEDFERDAPGDRDGPYQSADADEGFEGADADSPYQSASTDSPYQSAPTDSPYQSAPTDSPYQPAATDSPYRGLGSDSPYRSAGADGPYQGVDSDSPYQAAGETTQSEGLSATADGYRIRHPEPVTDVRVLR